MPPKIDITSIEQLHDFYGLPKPHNPLVSLIPITRHIVDFDYPDCFFVLSFYQIILKTGIVGSMDYGRNTYDFQEGTILFLKPNQLIKTQREEDYSSCSGWMLMFHPDLIRKFELGRIIDQYKFFSYEVREALHLANNEQIALTHLTEKIEYECHQPVDRYSQELIVSNIKLLLDYCLRYYDRQFNTRSELNKSLVANFENVLSTYYQEEKALELGVPTVKYLGERLNLSPHYLSDLLRKETGKSTQEHIYGFVIDRAKTQLLSTNKPVNEIAYDLGFAYPNHFSKLFKSKTGISPLKYRNIG